MQNPNGVDAQQSEISLVYGYLLAGIMLLVAVFLFLPRIAIG